MGTTRVKVIDLSSDQKEIKTSRKHAEKLSKPAQAHKEEKKTGEPEEIKIDQHSGPEPVIETPQDSGTKTAELATKEEEIDQGAPETKKQKSQGSKKNTSHHKGAKYQKAAALIEKKDYTITEALDLLPQTSFIKFDPTVEVHLAVSEKSMKLTVPMPHLKEEKKENPLYLIFGDKKEIKDQKILWGDDKTIAEIEVGNIKPGKDFTTVIAEPKYMPKLAKIAKILGPKGLMPNPKNGTVTDNFEKLFQGVKTAGLSIKTDPTTPTIHTKIGKLSQKPEELQANFKALVTTIGPSKIKKATITTTMGPAIPLDTTKLIAAQ